jgi:dipeptidyl aminopeptidase/acylaminoacyl peptidase
MTRKIAAWLVAVGLAATALPALSPDSAFAAPAPLIPREVLFGNPERVSPQISPDGQWLAYLAPDDKDVLQVWVRRIDQKDAVKLTNDPKRGIRNYLWGPDGKHLLYLQDTNGDENFHIYASNMETKETRDLTPFPGVRAIPVEVDTDHPNKMLIATNQRSKQVFDVHSLELSTGATTMIAENPGNVGGWLADRSLAIRGRLMQMPDGSSELQVRDTAEGEWRKLLAWPSTEVVNAFSFTGDDKGIFLASSIDANAARLVVLDIATGKSTVLSEDPRFDVADVGLHPKTRAAQAVQYNKARREWVLLDKSLQGDLDAVRKLSDGDFLPASRTDDDMKWVVSYTRDAGSVRYYLYDRKTKQGELLFSAQPKLDNYTLAPMEPVVVKSRDGLELQCYVTKPVGADHKSLPAVLYVHGGPWARDSWGYSAAAQWFANRGYVCIQPNYRGSTGFGKDFLNAANKEFAGKMHDDLLDVVAWATKSGLVDPKKVAIMGGSYGGYATLVGLTFTPDVFACGVDIVGPSNLVSLIESFPPYWKPFLASTWYPRVGDPSDPAQRKDLEARSPLFKVDAIKKPLIIAQGANDPRVTKKESDQIVDAMKKSGKDVEYFVFADEGHGLARPENRLKFNAQVERFLAKHLGGRAEPIPAELNMEMSSTEATPAASATK